MQQAGQQIQEVALRIREMRNIMGYSTAEMAIRTQVEEATYVEYETGLIDLPFSFISVKNNILIYQLIYWFFLFCFCKMPI